MVLTFYGAECSLSSFPRGLHFEIPGWDFHESQWIKVWQLEALTDLALRFAARPPLAWDETTAESLQHKQIDRASKISICIIDVLFFLSIFFFFFLLQRLKRDKFCNIMRLIAVFQSNICCLQKPLSGALVSVYMDCWEQVIWMSR